MQQALEERIVERLRTSCRFGKLGVSTVIFGRPRNDSMQRFMKAQMEKFQAGKDLRCSDGLASKIRKIALEEDLGL